MSSRINFPPCGSGSRMSSSWPIISSRSSQPCTKDPWAGISESPWPAGRNSQAGKREGAENRIERAVLITSGTRWTSTVSATKRRSRPDEDFPEEPLFLFSEDMEKNMIFKALGKTNGNRNHAAELFGKSDSPCYSWSFNF